MGLAEVQKLVADGQGEWEHLEFKKATGELHGGMETPCAFLNPVDWKVLLGVTNAEPQRTGIAAGSAVPHRTPFSSSNDKALQPHTGPGR
jgi:hypothetical protein